MNMRNSCAIRYGWICLAPFLGCGPAPEDPTPELTAIVSTSLAALRHSETSPAAPKVPRANCPTCKGTGRVPSGDGLGTTECDRCEPPLKAEDPAPVPVAKPPAVAVPLPFAPAPAICPPGGCPPTSPYIIRRR